MTKTRTGAQYLLVVAAALATRQLVHAQQQRRRRLAAGPGGADQRAGNWSTAITDWEASKPSRASDAGPDTPRSAS